MYSGSSRQISVNIVTLRRWLRRIGRFVITTLLIAVGAMWWRSAYFEDNVTYGRVWEGDNPPVTTHLYAWSGSAQNRMQVSLARQVIKGQKMAAFFYDGESARFDHGSVPIGGARRDRSQYTFGNISFSREGNAATGYTTIVSAEVPYWLAVLLISIIAVLPRCFRGLFAWRNRNPLNDPHSGGFAVINAQEMQKGRESINEHGNS